MNQTDKKTNLQKCFELFLGHDELRPVFDNPFVIENNTYATNAHVLIYCDSKHIDFEFKNKETAPNAKAIVPKENTSQIIDVDSIDWESFKTADEFKYIGDEIECGHCNGDGEFDVYYKNRYYDCECPVCDGSGYEAEPIKVKTGNKTFKDYDVIKLKNLYFNINLFYKVKQVKDLIGGDVELVHFPELEKAILFKINFAFVLIEPFYKTSDDESVVYKID
jgi:hypothetical protein